MSANPLTYSELEAFERKALVRFSAWEADLIMRVDDTVLGAWSGESAPPKPPPSHGGEEYAASDVASLKAMVKARALATKARREAEQRRR